MWARGPWAGGLGRMGGATGMGASERTSPEITRSCGSPLAPARVKVVGAVPPQMRSGDGGAAAPVYAVI